MLGTTAPADRLDRLGSVVIAIVAMAVAASAVPLVAVGGSAGRTLAPSALASTLLGPAGPPLPVSVPRIQTYTVAFTESGLPAGTRWSVALNGVTESSTMATVSFTEPDGTYPFGIGVVSMYQPTLANGTVVVNGTSVSRVTWFIAVPLGHYLATFEETGSPNGTTWDVLFNGTLQTGSSMPSFNGTIASTARTQLSFALTNGVYPFLVPPLPTCRGCLVVLPNVSVRSPLEIQGAPLTVAINFSDGQAVADCLRVSPNTSSATNVSESPYLVTFPESGLSATALWNVGFNGTNLLATATSFSYVVGNGTYDYTIDAPGWHQTALPYSGWVMVNGTSVTEATLTFVQVTYTVKFAETGLPAGMMWSVTFNGTSYTMTAGPTAYTIEGVINGTYPFGVTAVSGYRASPSGGNLTVSGASVTETVAFSSTSSTASTPIGVWVVIGVVTTAVAVGVAVSILTRSRRH